MAGTGTTTVDFGATPVGEATFTISDAGVSAASYVEAWFQYNDTTAGNVAEMHKTLGFFCKPNCSAGSSQFLAYCGLTGGLATGQYKLRYAFTP